MQTYKYLLFVHRSLCNLYHLWRQYSHVVCGNDLKAILIILINYKDI